MIAKILFLVYPLLLILLPVFFYRKYKPTHVTVWIRMAYDKNGLKMASNMLALVVIFFHLTYFSLFPDDIGIAVSTVMVFFLLSTKHSVRLTLSIRRNKYLFRILALMCVLMLLLPHTLSIAYSLAAILECACFFPAEGLENFYEQHVGEEDVDNRFVDAYFSDSKTTDNNTSMQRSVFSDIITYDKVIDNKIDLIRKMSFKKLTKLIKEIDFKNRSKLIALSNNKEQ